MSKMFERRGRPVAFLAAVILGSLLLLLPFGEPAAQAQGAKPQIPRTADGKPNLQGIWQVRNRAAYGIEPHMARHRMPAGPGVVDGGTIPYQEWALKQRDQNYANRYTEDPLSKCYMPGVPRIMYLEHPFQIFQTPQHIAMTFEFNLAHRLIYTNGSKPVQGIEFWMGDSRGRWEGDTLVSEVTNHNGKPWLDMAGNFYSAAAKLTERFTLADADTIRYEVTVDDPKVFTRAWKMTMPIYRQKDMDRVYEYHCKAEESEANGNFERVPQTWYPK